MRVVHVKSHPFTHYIGRGYMPNAPTGKAQPIHANLGNPFVLGGAMTRDLAISEFERWTRTQPAVLARIKALPEDAVLGCWCSPRPCHGDVIVKLWKEMHA